VSQFIKTPIGRLRLIGILEGLSFIVLLFLAVPVKYILGNPLPVRIVGMTHGMLFILFVMYTIGIASSRQWSFSRITWKLLLASVVPFGTFYVDRKVLRPMEQR
jgi:integral membrane protein